MSIKSVKTDTVQKAKNRVKGIMVAIGLIIFTCVAVAVASMESRKTISVVQVGGTPIGANAMINENMIKEYKMYYKEYEQYGTLKFKDGSVKGSVVLWKDRDQIIGKRYAGYYLREGTVLFWDSTVKEQAKKNSYLYSMDGELLNIQLNTSDFGNMVVPGDIINVRVSYTETNYDLTSEEQYELAVNNGGTISAVETKVIKKFLNEVPVLDMLNSDNESIFDIYYEYISKTKAEQSALLSDDKFLARLEPKSILIEATAEAADSYLKIKDNSPTYLVTLCPRTGSNAILDSLSEIQTALAGKTN